MIKQIGTLNIEIERRKIKNINIYVKPPNGDVLVTVPMRVSDEEVFRFLKKKEEWILKNHEKVKNRQNSSQQEINLEQRKSIMKVHANGFTIRDMKTRWGSCSIHSKKIRMNLQLAVKSEECVEYVLVHELCHLLEPSHNQRFYDLMSHFLPDWRERKQKLNEKV